MDEVIYTFDDVINKAGCTEQILTGLLEILIGKTVYGDRTLNGYDSPPITFSKRKIRPNLPIFTQLQYEYLVNIARKHQDKLASKQQSKPTYEQLEATITELKAENERLNDRLRNTPTETTEHPNSLNKSKGIIKALYELANKPSHKQIINKAEQLGYAVSSDTLTKRLN